MIIPPINVHNMNNVYQLIIISDSEKEAIDLVEKDCFRQELIEWRVQKIGIAADNYYGPAIIMKGV